MKSDMGKQDWADFETSSPQVVNTLLTIASFPGGEAIMTFNNQTYEVTVKPVLAAASPPKKGL